ncbi:hypothetical protein DL766_000083 [Monosporascus sp. MC13-8B]|uniref:Uncharacterized protein n=1 Tax=Monosporascus cannonballus TaxID=155416 RepID=A0ABY0GWU8_9PEZI|nr:hypothetical protein DL762_008313 [Monosporascus cannonballus]RYP40059.1 hypothetical protein DL766_000083 [Monosporascus sp. MC13-8B]
MLSSAGTVVPSRASGTAMNTTLYFDPLYDHTASSTSVPRAFKQHKTLPHPRKRRDERLETTVTDTPSRSVASSVDTASSLKHSPSSHSSGASTLEYERPGIRAPGPDLPPTPPAHSRGSPGNHSVVRSSPTRERSPARTPTNSSSRTPGTPPNQRSPPTPDGTPPKAERPLKAFRPVLADRIPSKGTSDSRSGSFKTAPEIHSSSEEDERSTVRAPRYSGRPESQSTVRPVTDSRQKGPQDVGLGLGLDSGDYLAPRTKQEFFSFDGEWASPSEVEQEWDNNLDRNVVVRKRRARTDANGRREEVIDDSVVSPTNATKAVRSMALEERAHVHHSTKESVDRTKRWVAQSNPEHSIDVDARRSSVMSSNSASSTVVEALLVETQPRRQKTLRHVKKQTRLRDSSSEFSPSSSAATSLGQSEITRRPRASGRLINDRTESQISTGTVSSIASHKARREVWKNGGIPVVVIPDRRASMKPTQSPSLRSANSQRSKRSSSLGSAPLPSQSKTKGAAPLSDRPSRRSRTVSESDGSFWGHQLTMDYPPAVPLRRSSLSAPTSRNGSRATSRAGSLTAESLKAHNALQQEHESREPEPEPQIAVQRVPSVEYIRDLPDQNRLGPVASVELHRDFPEFNRSLVDHNGDPFFGKRLTTHNTPFSQASVESNGTHSVADISEAMAVNIYPHQNKSVLMVHHLSKHSDFANALQRNSLAQTEGSAEPEATRDIPEITANGPDGAPVTPPQPQMIMDDVDSPLRNPRAPPEPPAIKFIPATPSGLTPAAEKEKMLGNYFEMEKRPSLVRRAFSLRKSSDGSTPRAPGFLSRTLSYSRNTRKVTAENSAVEKGKGTAASQYPSEDETPPDETKLHPFWRPASQVDVDDRDDYIYDAPREVDTVYRYPVIDNRPAPPRRSLSSRMKRTFAILPIQSDDHYTTAEQRSPERRTIRRSPSGHLRVMRSRGSYGSLRLSSSHSREQEDGRPSTAPDRPQQRRLLFPGGVEKNRVDSQGRRLFPGWQDKVQQYGLQNLQRRLSEHRRQKRTQELRGKISGPREVRDGVGEVIKRNSYKGPSYQGGVPARSSANGAFENAVKHNGLVH